MKIAVILENSPGCALDRAEFEVPDDHAEFEDLVSAGVTEALAEWAFNVGDTIRIVDVAEEES